jgi:hypothetical protein
MGSEAERRSMRPSLMGVLVDSGVASEEDVRFALAEGAETGEKLGEVLVRRGFLDEEHLGRLLAQQWDLPFLSAEDADAAHALRTISAEDAKRLDACPIALPDGRHVVAIVEPGDDRIAAASAIGGEGAVAVMARPTLDRLLNQLDTPETPLEAQAEQSAPDPDDEVETDLLLAEVESAAARLDELRSRVQRLAENDRNSAATVREHELEIQSLVDARAADAATIERLEQELAAQRRLVEGVRTQLQAVADLLDHR